MYRAAIVAGEASGDFLGADLIRKVHQYHPDVSFYGVGGAAMNQAGCECLYPSSELSVMGISEVFKKYTRISGIRRNLRNNLLDNPPDVFIGIDAPDFNFALEKHLRRHSIKVIHYVSPSVWAWREYRIKSIKQSVDLLLTLFPFENSYYEKYGVPVTFVGHPIVDRIRQTPGKQDARKLFNLDPERPVIAIMPGSRPTELQKHVYPFTEAALQCLEHNSAIQLICNLVNMDDMQYFESAYGHLGKKPEIIFTSDQSLEVMSAADIILLASGTVALEAMLLKKPMVVGYRVNWLTYQLAKRLIKLPYVSLPNILARQKIVPECLQDECRGDILAENLMSILQNKSAVQDLIDKFISLGELLAPIPGEQLSDKLYDFIRN